MTKVLSLKYLFLERNKNYKITCISEFNPPSYPIQRQIIQTTEYSGEIIISDKRNGYKNLKSLSIVHFRRRYYTTDILLSQIATLGLLVVICTHYTIAPTMDSCVISTTCKPKDAS